MLDNMLDLLKKNDCHSLPNLFIRFYAYRFQIMQLHKYKFFYIIK